MKLAKDIEVGDELLGTNRERNRVYQVQRLPGGYLLVSWHAGGHFIGASVYRPDQVVTEYADEFGMYPGFGL